MIDRGVSKPGSFLPFLGKVLIVSRTLSGPSLVGSFNKINRPRKRKRTNQENLPKIGKISETSGKSDAKRTKRKRDKRARSGSPPV